MNKRNRIFALAGLLAIVGFVAGFTAAPLAFSNVYKETPYTTTTHQFDSTRGYQVGGALRLYLAQDSLKIGDVVFDTADNKVAKSATLVMYNKVIGVVVGGARTSFRAALDSTDVGTLAATANQRVYLLRQGRVWVATTDSVYFGGAVIPSTVTAGTVVRRTTAIDTFYRVIGKAVYTRASGAKVLVDLNVK